jgi:hypothetical protein
MFKNFKNQQIKYKNSFTFHSISNGNAGTAIIEYKPKSIIALGKNYKDTNPLLLNTLKNNSDIVSQSQLKKPKLQNQQDFVRNPKVLRNSIFVKNKIKFIHFPVSRFSYPKFKSFKLENRYIFIDFIKVLCTYLNFDETYAVLVKIRMIDKTYATAGKHFVFVYDRIEPAKTLRTVFRKIHIRILKFLDKYNIESVDIVTIMLVNINTIPKVSIKNVNKIKFNKEFVNITHVKRNFNDKLIPLTMDLSYYGTEIIPISYETSNIIHDIEYKGINLFNKLKCEHIEGKFQPNVCQYINREQI